MVDKLKVASQVENLLILGIGEAVAMSVKYRIDILRAYLEIFPVAVEAKQVALILGGWAFNCVDHEYPCSDSYHTSNFNHKYHYAEKSPCVNP